MTPANGEARPVPGTDLENHKNNNMIAHRPDGATDPGRLSGSGFRVQTPDQARVVAEHEARRAAESPPAVESRRPLHLVRSTPDVDAEDVEHVNATNAPDAPLMRQLLAAHAAGDLAPEPVALGPLPVWASPQMRNIADDLRDRFGLTRAVGVYRAVPYAISEAVRLGLAWAPSSASYALRQLCDEGVILHVGNLKPLGKRDGTKLYVPPSWQPTDPAARAVVAETGRHDQAADLTWIPAPVGEQA